MQPQNMNLASVGWVQAKNLCASGRGKTINLFGCKRKKEKIMLYWLEGARAKNSTNSKKTAIKAAINLCNAMQVSQRVQAVEETTYATIVQVARKIKHKNNIQFLHCGHTSKRKKK